MGRKRKPPKPVALSSAEREALLHAAGLELAPDGVRSTGPGRPLVRWLSQLWRNALAARPVDAPTWRELARRKLAQVVREPVSEYLPDPVFAVTAAGLAALWSAAPEDRERPHEAAA